MGLLNRLLGKQRQLEGLHHQTAKRSEAIRRGDSVRIRLVDREWDKPDDPGEDDIWGRGFAMQDDRGIIIRQDDPELDVMGVTITKVVGVTHYGDAIRQDCFAPGQAVLLVHEPDNPYDSNAVAVYDADRKVKVGHLPREVAGHVASALDSRMPLKAICLWEWVKKPSNERVGIKLFIAPEASLLDPE